MTLHTTHGSYKRPTFDPRAAFCAARDMTWGNNAVGYVKIHASLETPLDLQSLDPPCDEVLAAKLYRTGFLAMVLTDDGAPKLRAQHPEPEPVPVPPQPSEPKPDPEPAPMPPAASGLTIKSHGFGRFSVVDRDDNRVAPEEGWLTKPEAEAIVARS